MRVEALEEGEIEMDKITGFAPPYYLWSFFGVQNFKMNYIKASGGCANLCFGEPRGVAKM